MVLLEYWLAPLFLGITNYAGLWSDAGVLLFVSVVASLVVFVFVPLIPHLRTALTTWRRRLVFHGVWAGSFVAGLFVTNVLQFTDGPSTPAVLLGATTVYSPFGAWPSLTTYFPAVQLWAAWNVEQPTVLVLLSLLCASSIVLGSFRAPRACPLPAARAVGWRGRLASAGVLAPLGLVSACPGCAPLYFAALSLAAPATVTAASSSLPLTPWIGFAGLLLLASYALALWLIRRATDPAAPPEPRSPGD